MEAEYETWKAIYHQRISNTIWVVRLETLVDGRSMVSTGTGFSIDGDGHIMTCNHVLDTREKATVSVRKTKGLPHWIRATIVRTYPMYDIAILKKPTTLRKDREIFAEDGSLVVGQTVAHIGNPYNMFGSFFRGKVSFPIFKDAAIPQDSQTCRNFKSNIIEFEPPRHSIMGHIWNSINRNFDTSELHPQIPLIHINGFGICSGCSGGPVYNLKGEVIGMVILSDRYETVAIHVNLLRYVSETFFVKATKTRGNPSKRHKGSVMNVTTADKLKKTAACIVLGNELVDMRSLTEESAERIAMPLQPIIEDTQASASGSVEIDRGDELEDPESHSLVVVPQNQLTSSQISDIAKGEEFVEIPWLNEINKECPPSFNYISQNLIFQNAHVKFTLSQIKAENCCSTCIGDCLSSTTVCACASENGDKFAYNSHGLLTEEFLEDCISITRDPQRQCLSYCKACPLERSKNEEILEPCKGHVKRNYIKECWSKCACHKLCGNRVVQRGIMSQLQVFFTPEGKGWGLRTLDKLPKGIFVCEYVGEILTGKELQERKMQRTRGTNVNRRTCSVLLDAYWCLKGAVKDEETLCLDATSFGNVARFINHREFRTSLAVASDFLLIAFSFYG
ncbi:uncharacterized protein LOC126655593 isoform X2 [Mercurialis annua]|uniref:uncharacterized protein LOC126655593 isoform X2 n=1 Tax=Mercurialis annua TaxID=3986 RepID=UPI00215F14A0|nr:uncharacterized protein LOC126655593 isoform X2 [Mercurialis annua]